MRAQNDLHKINNTGVSKLRGCFMVLSDNVDYNDSDGYYLYEMGKMEGNSSAMMYSARRFFPFLCIICCSLARG